jgi:hypothetical protein
MAIRGEEMTQRNLYELEKVGRDFIIIADRNTEVKITVADREDPYDDLSPTKSHFLRRDQQQDDRIRDSSVAIQHEEEHEHLHGHSRRYVWNS